MDITFRYAEGYDAEEVKKILDATRPYHYTTKKLEGRQPERGEWTNEPDKEEFEHAGLKCLILKHPEMLHLCGYVGVPKEHPWYGKLYNQCLQGCRGRKTKFPTLNRFGFRHYDCLYKKGHKSIEGLINVHGGITFSQEGGGSWPEGYWWFGFDCAHSGDLVPFLSSFCSPRREDVYRNIEYVRKETRGLAEQLKGVKDEDHKGSDTGRP